ncbi:hypothetical protein KKF86_04830 [bacterium]|nr:hypothetical protein [bacterium]
MEGIGIWIFLLLFYLLQALAKRKRQQQKTEAQPPKPQRVPTSQQRSEPQKEKASQRPPRPVSLEDLFNPNKLRDILGVPQPESVEEPAPEPVPEPINAGKVKMEMRKKWEDPQQVKSYFQNEPEVLEPISEIVSEDITEVDETTAEFKASGLSKSDITSDRFDERKVAPGKKKEVYTLEYFDEPQDIRNAVILKEILDRPRAFRRQIR